MLGVIYRAVSFAALRLTVPEVLGHSADEVPASLIYYYCVVLTPRIFGRWVITVMQKETGTAPIREIQTVVTVKYLHKIRDGPPLRRDALQVKSALAKGYSRLSETIRCDLMHLAFRFPGPLRHDRCQVPRATLLETQSHAGLGRAVRIPNLQRHRDRTAKMYVDVLEQRVAKQNDQRQGQHESQDNDTWIAAQATGRAS